MKTALLLIAGIVGNVQFATAQPTGKIPRIGYISGTADPVRHDSNFEAFRQGLHDLGYIEHKSIEIEFHSYEGRQELNADLSIRECFSMKCRFSIGAEHVYVVW
jgi:hypothetical protein